MPTKESHERHRMVVEEVEVPAEVSESPKKELVDETEKVSSEELIKDNVQVVEKTSEPPTTESPKEMPDKPQYFSSNPYMQQKQKSPVFWILIPGIFILGAILGGIIFYQKGVSTKTNETPAPSSSPSSTSTPIPSSSPSSTIDVSGFKVAVYNGSGIAGEAGKVKTILEDAGFTVSSTGNAATYDYTDSIIKAKSTVDDAVIGKFKAALSKSYKVGESETLSASSSTDIQVVVGSSKAE